jgi:ribosome biogenesis protein ERB1
VLQGMARNTAEPLKRKVEIVEESALSDDEDDGEFELASLDGDDSAEDDDFDESDGDASSESGDASDDEEQEDSEETLPNDKSNGAIDGTDDGTESENLLSDASSDSYSTSEEDQDIVVDADGNPRTLLPEIDPHYDSDSSTQSDINTIGNIDVEKYYPASMPHIGYDINGKRIMRPATGAALDQLLDTIDLPAGWTGVLDKNTGQLKNLTDEELDIIKRIRRQELPSDTTELYDPYRFPEEDPFPLCSAPEPKRRFLPSKHEAIRIMKIVRAIREGKIVKKPPPKSRSQVASYDIWSSDPVGRGDVNVPKTQHIPAPKLKLPDHDESYHPPPEYLPTDQERQEWEAADEEDRENEFLPRSYDRLARVPAWASFISERFERCLDLYLAPRVMKQRLNIDPDSLIPKLPSPRELRPFPTRVGVVYEGHTDAVKTVSVDPTGAWVATGSFDGTVRVWELATGRQVWKWNYPRPGRDEVVSAMEWNPVKEIGSLAVVVGETIYLLIPPVWMEAKEAATREVLEKGFYAEGGNKNEASGVKWSKGKDDQVALIIKTAHTIEYLTWHRRGDYFATVAPQGPPSPKKNRAPFLG